MWPHCGKRVCLWVVAGGAGIGRLCSPVKEKTFMTLVSDGKADFIQGHPNRSRDCCSGVLQWAREMGLHLKSIPGKWEFINKEQGGGQCMENYQEETLG